jgi:hypothetical protein
LFVEAKGVLVEAVRIIVELVIVRETLKVFVEAERLAEAMRVTVKDVLLESVRVITEAVEDHIAVI